MAPESITVRADELNVCDESPDRTVVPPAFYRDEDPPEPPEGDPHWREFPLFDAMKGSRLVIAVIALSVVFVTLVHLAVLLFI